jgi:hypothetical protein
VFARSVERWNVRANVSHSIILIVKNPFTSCRSRIFQIKRRQGYKKLADNSLQEPRDDVRTPNRLRRPVPPGPGRPLGKYQQASRREAAGRIVVVGTVSVQRGHLRLLKSILITAKASWPRSSSSFLNMKLLI